MTFQPGQNVYTQATGSYPQNVEVPIIQTTAPTLSDINYPLGKRWVDKVAGNEYCLTSFSSSSTGLTANWAFLGSSSGDLNSLTTDDMTVVTPTAGTILFHGTANQIVTTGGNAPGQVTAALSPTLVAPGSITATTSITSTTTMTAGTGLTVTSGGAAITGTTNINTTGAGVTSIGTGGTGATNIGNATGNTSVTGSLTTSTTLTATLGAITATNGNLVLGTAGNKILSTSVATVKAAGANAFGTVTLESGTVVVSTSAVTANSIIILTRQGPGATGAAALGQLSVGTISAGVSFVINALTTADSTAVATTDVSSIGWMIIN